MNKGFQELENRTSMLLWGPGFRYMWAAYLGMEGTNWGVRYICFDFC